MKKTFQKSIILLSSTKTAIFLMFLVIVSSIIGTFLTTYTFFNSYWYRSLLLLLLLSLLACSFTRYTYLFRKKSLKNSPNLKLRLNKKIKIANDTRILLQLKLILTKRKYKITDLGNTIIAEKNFFSRWGAFFIHIGIIILALGVLSRIIPGWYMNEFVWLRKGETVAIPETSLFLTNNSFSIERYENNLPKNYQTDIQVTEINGNLVADSLTQVNQPLKVNHLSVLQSDYQKVFSEMSISITDHQGNHLGNVKIDLFHPEKEIGLNNNYVLLVKEYFPDLSLDENQQPISKSAFPTNPAFVFQIKNTLNHSFSGQQWFILQNFTDPSLGQHTNFAIELNQFKDEYVTGLIIHKDIGKIFVFAGLFFSVFGLFVALYFQHKKILINATQSDIILEARTNRNVQGLNLEVNSLVNQIVGKELDINEQLASTIF